MIDQYFGIKELYELSLKAKTPMQFGTRYIQEGEPVLYFEHVDFSMLSERNSLTMVRGGWGNRPQVIWQDTEEMQFTLSEGVMSSISMSLLLNANVATEKEEEPLYINKREGPYPLVYDTNREKYIIYIKHYPILPPTRKVFILEYRRDTVQKIVYGKLLTEKIENDIGYPIELFYDKGCQEPIQDNDKRYIVDYYYKYENEALIYSVYEERFNGLFTLEGKFYSKDENEGKNYTNLIYMPKVRVVSDINLRLGERADPTVSTFNIIGLPEYVSNDKQKLILQITRLGEDIDDSI